MVSLSDVNVLTFKVPNILAVKTLDFFGGKKGSFVFLFFAVGILHFLAAIFLVNVSHMKNRVRKITKF